MPKSYSQKTEKSTEGEPLVFATPHVDNMGVANTEGDFSGICDRFSHFPEFASGVSLDWLEFTLFLRPPDAFFAGESAQTIIDERNKHRARFPTPDPRRAETLEDFALRLCSRTYDEHEADEPDAYIPQKYRRRAWEVADVPGLFGKSTLELSQTPRGAHGYKTRHTLGKIAVLSDGSPGMGTHVTITGEPLRDLAETGFNAADFLGRLESIGGQPSRLDGAIDDFDGLIDLPRLVEITEKGHAASPLKEFTIYKKGLIANGTLTGLTLYFGSFKSDVFGRIYDKRLEQIGAGVDPDKLPPSWVRVEIQTGGQAAKNMAAVLAAGEDLAALVRGMVANYFDFRIKEKDGRATTDTNKSRWDSLPAWDQFLAGATKRSIAKCLKKSTMDARDKWLKKQVSKSLAMIGHAYGTDHLTDIFTTGQRKITEEDQTAIQAGRAAARQRREKESQEVERWNKENGVMPEQVFQGSGI